MVAAQPGSTFTLLASAIVGRLQLWTADQGLSALARELGVAYSVPDPN